MRRPSVAYIMPAFHPRYDLLRKRLEVFTRVLHGVERGDVRALHRTRVASRRLREVLPILQVDADTTRKLVRRLRRGTDRLCPGTRRGGFIPVLEGVCEYCTF